MVVQRNLILRYQLPTFRIKFYSSHLTVLAVRSWLQWPPEILVNILAPAVVMVGISLEMLFKC